MHFRSARSRTLYSSFAALLLLFMSVGAMRGGAAPLPQTETGVGSVMAIALDDSGNGWAWAAAAPQKPATRYLLRIEDGSWRVATDSVDNAELLPLGSTISQLVITADGNDGWAIGNADDSTPLFWRFQNGEWRAVEIEVPASATQPHSISISSDGSDGWVTIFQEATGDHALFRLQDGEWTAQPQVEAGQLELAAISPDGNLGWGLGSPRPNSPQALYKLTDGVWATQPIEILDRGARASKLVADNEGYGWMIVDGTRVMRVGPDTELVEAYTAAESVTLEDVAVDGMGRGWVVGWLDLGQVEQPGNIQYLRSPVLIRLAGGMATNHTALETAFATDDVGVNSVSVSPSGAQAWAGLTNLDGFGLATPFHEPWPTSENGPTAASPLAGPGLCFADVPYCLRGPFLTYWQTHGGLDVLGLPVTSEIFEELEGKTYRVQYTERARLEEHPEFADTPNEVLLGLLGNELADDRTGEDPFRPVPALPDPPATQRWFETTGHTVGDPFLPYWQSNGDLSVFGYPRSEAFEEVNDADGNTYLVQYFERNRIEYHPENEGTRYEFLLGLLGLEHFADKYGYKP